MAASQLRRSTSSFRGPPLNGTGVLAEGPQGFADGTIYAMPAWAKIDDAARVRWIRENLIAEYAPDPRMRWFVAKILQDAGVAPRDYPGIARTLLAWVQNNVYYTHEKGESLQSPWRTLQHRTGDCLPAETRLVRKIDERRAEEVSLCDVRPGDLIWGRSRWSVVEGVVEKGKMPVDRLHMDAHSFDATSGHKVYLEPDLVRGTVQEIVARNEHPERIRVKAVEAGARLLSPLHRPKIGFKPEQEILWSDSTLLPDATVVRAIDRSIRETFCFDIQTDDHYVYLPEADVTVSNCDDSTILLCTMADAVGLPNRMVLGGRRNNGKLVRWVEGAGGRKVPRGVNFFHIYCELGWPPGRPGLWASADPSLQGAPLGYDLVKHGINVDQHGRPIGLGTFGGGGGGDSGGSMHRGPSGSGASGGSFYGGFYGDFSQATRTKAIVASGLASSAHAGAGQLLGANPADAPPGFFGTLLSRPFIQQMALDTVSAVVGAVAIALALDYVDKRRKR